MTTALKIEQLPADNSCQLNVSELKQVVGGNLFGQFANLMAQATQLNNPFGQVNHALLQAAYEAERRGDVNRADQLTKIAGQRQVDLFKGITQFNQVVAPA